MIERKKQTGSDFPFQDAAEASSIEKLLNIVRGALWLTKSSIVSERNLNIRRSRRQLVFVDPTDQIVTAERPDRGN